MDIYWLRKSVKQDKNGWPYRSWRQESMEPVLRYRDANKRGDTDLCLNLIDSGAIGVDHLMDDGRTTSNDSDDHWTWDSKLRPIHLAAATGNMDLLLGLIQRGADLTQKTLFQWSALHFAAAAQSMEACALLVERGLDIDETSSSRSTFWDNSVGPSPKALLREEFDSSAYSAWKKSKLENLPGVENKLAEGFKLKPPAI